MRKPRFTDEQTAMQEAGRSGRAGETMHRHGIAHEIPDPDRPPRPADLCGYLLAALDASEGRRRRRKRNTEPDAIGMAIKRRLLEDAVGEDPDAEAFEGWLLDRTLAAGGSGGGTEEQAMFPASGPVRAMALELLAEWRLAQVPGAFREWLSHGVPSDDRMEGT